MQNSNQTIRKAPPHSMESEQAVLASLLIDDKAMDKVLPVLDAEDFYVPGHRLIYRTLVDLFNGGKAVDEVTLLSALSGSGMMERAGGAEYLSSLVEIIPNAANVKHYADTVKDKAVLRRLIDLSVEISEECYAQSGEVSEMVDRVEQRIFHLAENRLKSDIRSLGSLMTSAFQVLENIYEKKGQITGVPTGYVDIDGLTNGMQPSDLIILAARPSMGKTALALNLALNAAYKKERPVAIFSLEMSSQQLVSRLLATEAQVDSSKLRNGRMNMEDWQKLGATGSELSEAPIYIDDTPAISVMELRAKCRRLKREHGLDMIIVDYLQLMRGGRNDSREQEIADISRSLKALAKELNVPVLALSQLNRSLESRTDKRPIMSDLRESGAIEQDADIIMFIYRDEVYNKEASTMPGIAEIIVSKHRNGATGTVYLAFRKELTRFENADIRGVH